jgi:hypothetical protein
MLPVRAAHDIDAVAVAPDNGLSCPVSVVAADVAIEVVGERSSRIGERNLPTAFHVNSENHL